MTLTARLRRTGAAVLATAVTALGLVALPAAPPAWSAVKIVQGVPMTAYDARILALVNKARTDRGVPALRPYTQLQDVASRWSVTMARQNRLFHNPSMAKQTWGSHCSGHAGENVGHASSTSADAMFAAYWNSSGHRANILSKNYRAVGITTVDRGRPATSGRVWNTMNFAGSCSTAYGVLRTQVWGLHGEHMGRGTVADFESARDARVGAHSAGAGVAVDPYRESAKAGGRDDFAIFKVRATTGAATGAGLFSIRQGVDLRGVKTVTVKAAAGVPKGKRLAVTVQGATAWGATRVIGTVHLDGAVRSVTIPVPAAAKAYVNHVQLVVPAGSLRSLSGAVSGQQVRLNVYGITAA